MITVVGCLADSLGFASQTTVVGSNHAGRTFDAKQEFFAIPSTEYRAVQQPQILVDLHHSRPIGSLRYLERNEQRLFGVAEIDGAQLDAGPWYFSPEVRHRAGHDVELLALAVVKQPAQIGLGPITAFAGSIHDAARQIVHQHGHAGALVKRARDYDRARRRDQALTIAAPPCLLPQPRFDTSYAYNSDLYGRTASGRRRNPIPPQHRPGWKPGDLEWSNQPGSVIAVR